MADHTTLNTREDYLASLWYRNLIEYLFGKKVADQLHRDMIHPISRYIHLGYIRANYFLKHNREQLHNLRLTLANGNAMIM